MKVYIVLEHPDMTYYGDGEIHAVETSREAAAAIARDKTAEMHMPEWQDSEWDRLQIEEWDVPWPAEVRQP